MAFPSQSRRGSDREAFTLIEVTLAVGLVATVLLGMAALIPVALTAQRDANHSNTANRIVQTFVGEMQLCNWEQLDTRYASETERTKYFDDQGTPLAGSGDHVYAARVYLKAGQGVELAPSLLPGDNPAGEDRSEHYRRIAIHVTAVPGSVGTDILDDATDSRVDSFVADIVNLRKRP